MCYWVAKCLLDAAAGDLTFGDQTLRTRCLLQVIHSPECQYLRDYANHLGAFDGVPERWKSSVWAAMFDEAVFLATMYHDIGYPWQFVQAVANQLSDHTPLPMTPMQMEVHELYAAYGATPRPPLNHWPGDSERRNFWLPVSPRLTGYLGHWHFFTLTTSSVTIQSPQRPMQGVSFASNGPHWQSSCTTSKSSIGAMVTLVLPRRILNCASVSSATHFLLCSRWWTKSKISADPTADSPHGLTWPKSATTTHVVLLR
jgi:hypothetical protein